MSDIHSPAAIAAWNKAVRMARRRLRSAMQAAATAQDATPTPATDAFNAHIRALPNSLDPADPALTAAAQAEIVASALAYRTASAAAIAAYESEMAAAREAMSDDLAAVAREGE